MAQVDDLQGPDEVHAIRHINEYAVLCKQGVHGDQPVHRGVGIGRIMPAEYGGVTFGGFFQAANHHPLGKAESPPRAVKESVQYQHHIGIEFRYVAPEDLIEVDLEWVGTEFQVVFAFQEGIHRRILVRLVFFVRDPEPVKILEGMFPEMIDRIT